MGYFSLPAHLTHAQANACVRDFESHVRAGESLWTIEAASLQRFDSSALAVLLSCRRLALEQGQTLRVVGLSPRLQALARLYGVQELLEA
jgi:phospholipid transport system transporter-binding protein